MQRIRWSTIITLNFECTGHVIHSAQIKERPGLTLPRYYYMMTIIANTQYCANIVTAPRHVGGPVTVLSAYAYTHTWQTDTRVVQTAMFVALCACVMFFKTTGRALPFGATVLQQSALSDDDVAAQCHLPPRLPLLSPTKHCHRWAQASIPSPSQYWLPTQSSTRAGTSPAVCWTD